MIKIRSICKNLLKDNIYMNIVECKSDASHRFYSDKKFHSNFREISKRCNYHSLIFVRCMAGHAKWQNVKHVKAEKDRQKNIVCNKFSYLIGMAVKEGGPDPKINIKLSNLIQQAKKSNVPFSTIEGALKKDTKKTKFGSMEIYGPGGCIVIVEYGTDNICDIRHAVKVACKKAGASVMSGEGRWRAVYEQKGVIKVISQKDGQSLDPEKAIDFAIEASAEEVQTKTDDDQNMFFEFLCAPDDLHPAKKELERHYDVEEGYVAYIPTKQVPLGKEEEALMDILLEELGNLSDIIRIYENTQ